MFPFSASSTEYAARQISQWSHAREANLHFSKHVWWHSAKLPAGRFGRGHQCSSSLWILIDLIISDQYLKGPKGNVLRNPGNPCLGQYQLMKWWPISLIFPVPPYAVPTQPYQKQYTSIMNWVYWVCTRGAVKLSTFWRAVHITVWASAFAEDSKIILLTLLLAYPTHAILRPPIHQAYPKNLLSQVGTACFWAEMGKRTKLFSFRQCLKTKRRSASNRDVIFNGSFRVHVDTCNLLVSCCL